MGSVLFFIYSLFLQFREKAFHQEQVVKIETAIKLLSVIKIIDNTIIDSIDRITINEMYDEKLLIFDRDKNQIYRSIDDTPIPNVEKILEQLSEKDNWVQQKDNYYDIVGMCIKQDGRIYYGISKAFDVSGYLVMDNLRKVLIFCFIGISLILFVSLYYLSEKITRSILHVTRQIKNYNFEKNADPIFTTNTKDEIGLLVRRFNELMSRMNKAYLFQKHAVHHISHELKTPISILVLNFEKIEKEKDNDKKNELIRIQKENTKSLSDIINSLLEISKVESGKDLFQTNVRIDELLFDISGELGVLYPDFKFSIDYLNEISDEKQLTIMANPRLLKAAMTNLMLNSSLYSSNNNARITIASVNNRVQIEFINQGIPINEEEQQYLFQHFFRGANSKGIKGFGLGLVLVQKIISIHRGQISYSTINNYNTFRISLPLS